MKHYFVLGMIIVTVYKNRTSTGKIGFIGTDTHSSLVWHKGK